MENTGWRVELALRLVAARGWTSRSWEGRWSGGGVGHIRTGGHGAFGIEQVIVAGPEAEFDQRARVGDSLVLPAIVGLESPQGVFRGGIPFSGRLAAEVVLTNERFLDLVSAVGINLLLPFYLFRALSLARSGLARGCSRVRGVRFCPRSRGLRLRFGNWLRGGFRGRRCGLGKHAGARQDQNPGQWECAF
jgi:hypothetical protein